VTTPAPSPVFIARLAGAFYLVTILTGGYALSVGGAGGVVAGIIAAASYIVVTLLLYYLLRPVSPGVSLLAMLVSLAGCAVGPLSLAVRIPAPNNIALVCFGFYCLLIGYLILRSTFLPRFVGALMVFAGLGWLIYAFPPLARALFPYVLAPGLIGEGALTLWLLVAGVDERQWTEQAGARLARAA
jgi:hypothetical protein